MGKQTLFEVMQLVIDKGYILSFKRGSDSELNVRLSKRIDDNTIKQYNKELSLYGKNKREDIFSFEILDALKQLENL